jgi:hypothetical protein
LGAWRDQSAPGFLPRQPIEIIFVIIFGEVLEVYLLVYYLPKSTTIYIGKQYEIILLIIIRRIFKDISNLELTRVCFAVKYDLIFLYDIVPDNC